MTEAQLAASLITFAEDTLGLRLYGWQARVLEPFDHASNRLVQVTLVSPNGAGKSSVCIPALILGWLTIYEKGRVALTTNDSKQLDNQVMPALNNYRHLFPTWKFIERRIETPTGGFFYGFTTTGGDRVEGAHKLDDTDGPLLAIVDEAKSVDAGIFMGIDRWTYNAILLTSSPGPMHGPFYDSHTVTPGFIRVKAGLADCPHIGPEKIKRLEGTYGEHGTAPNPAYLASTLHGEFMLADGEMRFDREGLTHLAEQVKAGAHWLKTGHLEVSRAFGTATFLPGDDWLWIDEPPTPGHRYLITVDPNTCEQAAGTTDRDNTSALVLREQYFDDEKLLHPDMVAAALTWPGGVKWDSDVLAERLKLMSDYYGGAMIVVECNNFGSALLKTLHALGVPLWRRTKIDDVNPNKRHRLLGWLTTERSRLHWVEAVAKAVRKDADGIGLECRFKPVVDELHTFILTPDGRAEAQEGTHDDHCAALGIGLSVRCFETFHRIIPQEQRNVWRAGESLDRMRPAPVSRSPFGACG